MPVTKLDDSMFVVASCASAYFATRSLLLASRITRMPDWKDLDVSAKQSLADKTESLLNGDTMENLHAKWASSMKADGWRYGDRYNGVLKIDPLLADYDQLEDVQRQYDTIFANMVKAAAKAMREIGLYDGIVGLPQ